MVKATGRLALILLCGASVCFEQTANAEFYVGGRLGSQISNNLGEVGTTGGSMGTIRFTDLDLKNSLVFGAKAGYFFPQLPNLGVEVSASHAKPDIKAQSSMVSGPIFGSGVFNRTSLRVVTVALNVIARAQLGQFGQLEPYVGAGLGLFFARLKDDTGQSWSDNGVPGFNVLAGYRSYLTKDKSLALMVEYNYQRARLNFRDVLNPEMGIGLKGDYEAHTITGGLSYHF